ncbi:Rho-binding antiterminator [Oceanimonas smirnovii]|uniref:Rho-binding antiterminator n=1 Tax=Oceanimonas smirnovii TaxID=264574 RepID=A0ABW7P090_9GAMM|nr:Rho-binding antiterminator [Oceanimonas smirnovii]
MMNCDQHDYLEIACMYRYEIRLILTTGEQITGIALDTSRNEHKEECLKLNTGTQVCLLPLSGLASMSATRPNPHFQHINFS